MKQITCSRRKTTTIMCSIAKAEANKGNKVLVVLTETHITEFGATLLSFIGFPSSNKSIDVGILHGYTDWQDLSYDVIILEGKTIDLPVSAQVYSVEGANLISRTTQNSKEPNMKQTYAYLDPDGAITKLTEEQKNHYKRVVSYCEDNGLLEQLGETTHLSMRRALDFSLSKVVDGKECYFSPNSYSWVPVDVSGKLYQKPNIMITEHSSDYKASLTSGETLHDAVVDWSLYSEDSDNTFPDFPFYVMDTKGNRQWLKDNGCKWANGDNLVEHPFNHSYSGKLYVIVPSKMVFEDTPIPEKYKHIDTHLSVTSWSLSESEKKRQEKIDSISEKEQTINQLKERMKELEKDVDTLKESL